MEGLNGYENIDRMLYHKGLLFVSEINQTELISRYYNNSLGGFFDIDKTRELISRKYY